MIVTRIFQNNLWQLLSVSLPGEEKSRTILISNKSGKELALSAEMVQNLHGEMNETFAQVWRSRELSAVPIQTYSARGEAL